MARRSAVANVIAYALCGDSQQGQPIEPSKQVHTSKAAVWWLQKSESGAMLRVNPFDDPNGGDGPVREWSIVGYLFALSSPPTHRTATAVN